jgi:hypothetical protein
MKSSFYLILASLLSITACEKSTEPLDGIINPSSNEYMSLNIGDIRQFSMPYSTNDTIYTVWKITGKTFRSDGIEVFISEWSTYDYRPQNKYLEHCFIKDGFYYFTELEKSLKVNGNPYFEQKLAKIKPQEGDTWLQTEGFNPGDSITAKRIYNFVTPAGTFFDVYSFVSIFGSKTYYSKYYGYLGISFSDDRSDLFIVNYMKIKGKEIGKYVEMK